MNNDYAKYIDHTLLKVDASYADIVSLCNEAKEYGFKSVCVNPFYVAAAKDALSGCDVLVCTVIGFPLGANDLDTKLFEAKRAIEDGADEIDMVINIGALKNKAYDYLFIEISEIKKLINNHVLKVIIETCLLNEDEIIKISNIAKDAGADYIKTSTGFSREGATIEAVKLIRNTVGNSMGVKASGGIRSREDMIKMIEAGANRIGTSNGVKIMKEIYK